MKTDTTNIAFQGGHRWTFGAVHSCELCHTVTTDIEATPACSASDDDRTEFDKRFSPAKEETCEFDIEYTDTFGGEANYSWVRRKTLTLPASISDRALVRLAKAEMGLTGWKCRKEDHGETIALYPQGACQVLFITPRY